MRKRTAEVDLELEQAPDDVDDAVWVRVRRDRVVAAMATLPEAQRTALELAFFGGLTHVEVAEKLDIPLGTAKTRIRTALLRLREVIGSSLSDGDDGGPLVRPGAPAGGRGRGARRASDGRAETPPARWAAGSLP